MAPVDEYDEYARDLVAMLDKGADEADLARDLASARRLVLLAAPDPTGDARAARTVFTGESSLDL